MYFACHIGAYVRHTRVMQFYACLFRERLGFGFNRICNGQTVFAVQQVFVVGNGTTASTRSDAVTVMKNGAVLVHPSGDLQMGNYIAGPQP